MAYPPSSPANVPPWAASPPAVPTAQAPRSPQLTLIAALLIVQLVVQLLTMGAVGYLVFWLLNSNNGFEVGVMASQHVRRKRPLAVKVEIEGDALGVRLTIYASRLRCCVKLIGRLKDRAIRQVLIC